jgi:hypothetical protein
LAPVFTWQKEDAFGKRIARIESDPKKIHHRDGTTSTAYKGDLRVEFPKATTSYNEWMQSMINSSDPRNVAFAREALGPTRFNLVKSGKVQMESLYYQGKIRTIKELKELSS